MKKEKLKVLAIIAGVMLMVACGPKKDTQRESEKMEMTEAQPTTDTSSEVKAFTSVNPSLKLEINDLLKPYFEIVKSLADDHTEKAKAAAITLTAQLSKVDMSKLTDDQMAFYHQHEGKIAEALKSIETNIDIEAIRTQTASISDNMYALLKAFGGNGVAVYYNFCPMAKNNEGAFWLSDTKEISNPYMGQSMPTCGTTKEVLK